MLRNNLRVQRMDFFISRALAQTGDAASSANPLSSMLFMVILMAGMFFLMIRPQMKRAKEQRNMLTALAKGDEVITNGGLLGRVDEIGESFIVLEIAANVKVKLQKQAINAVLPKGTLKST